MPTLDDIRKMYPGSENFSDYDVVKRLAESTGTPMQDMASYVGYKPSGGVLKDTAIDVGKGLVGLGQIATGAANLATGGASGKAIRNTFGGDLTDVQNAMGRGYSDARQDSDEEVNKATGFWDSAKEYATHPRTLVGGVVESLPSMLLPGAIAGKVGKGVLGGIDMATASVAEKAAAQQAAKVASNTASTATWGGMTATQTADKINHEQPDNVAGMYAGSLSAGAAVAALTHGASLLPGGHMADAVTGGVGKRLGINMANQAGMMSSMGGAQTGIENVATGKPWDEGMAKSLGTSFVSGGLFGIHGGLKNPHTSLLDAANKPAEQADTKPQLPAIPDVLYGMPGGDILNADQSQKYNDFGRAAAQGFSTDKPGAPPVGAPPAATGTAQVDPAAAGLAVTQAGKTPGAKAYDPGFTEEQRQAIYGKFGEPTPNMVTHPVKGEVQVGTHFDTSTVPDKNGAVVPFTSPEKIDGAVAKLVKADSTKQEGHLAAEQSLSDALNDKDALGRRPTSAEIAKVSKAVDLQHVTDPTQLVGHIDVALAELAQKKTPDTALQDHLTIWRKALDPSTESMVQSVAAPEKQNVATPSPEARLAAKAAPAAEAAPAIQAAAPAAPPVVQAPAAPTPKSRIVSPGAITKIGEAAPRVAETAVPAVAPKAPPTAKPIDAASTATVVEAKAKVTESKAKAAAASEKTKADRQEKYDWRNEQLAMERSHQDIVEEENTRYQTKVTKNAITNHSKKPEHALAIEALKERMKAEAAQAEEHGTALEDQVASVATHDANKADRTQDSDTTHHADNPAFANDDVTSATGDSLLGNLSIKSGLGEADVQTENNRMTPAQIEAAHVNEMFAGDHKPGSIKYMRGVAILEKQISKDALKKGITLSPLEVKEKATRQAQALYSAAHPEIEASAEGKAEALKKVAEEKALALELSAENKAAEKTKAVAKLVALEKTDAGRAIIADAAKDWDQRRTKASDPKFDTLSDANQAAWVSMHESGQSAKLHGDHQTLDRNYNDLHEEIKNDPTNNLRSTAQHTGTSGTGNEGRERGSLSVPAHESGRPGEDAEGTGVDGAGAGNAQSKDGGNTTVAIKGRRKVVVPTEGTAAPAPAGERKGKISLGAKEQPKFGKDAAAPENAHTAESLTADLKSFMHTDSLGRNVIIVDHPEQLGDLRDSTTGIANGEAFGWTRDGKAILIASRIDKANGRASFMHEVGSHLGLDRLLTKDQHTQLTDQIAKWAKADDGSQESRIAKAAMERVESAGTDDKQRASESLAYFTEEAMKAGIDPTAMNYSTPIGRWFRTMWSAVKNAIRGTGVDASKMKAQDIVDMAYGAARMEMAGKDTVGSSEIKFGKNSPVPPAEERRSFTAKTIAKLPVNLQSPVRRIVANIHDVTTKATMSTAFMYDLADWGGKHGLPALKKIADVMAERGAFKVQLDQKLGGLAERFGDLKPDAQAALQKYLHDATTSQKWGYQPSWRDQVTIDAGAKAQYDALGKLSPEAQKLSDDMFAHGADTWQQKQDAVKDITHAHYTQEVANAEAAGKDQTHIDGLWKELENITSKGAKLDGPYSPLKRFGDHVVSMQSHEFRGITGSDTGTPSYKAMQSNPAHNLREDYATAGEAANRVAELQAQYGSDTHKVYHAPKEDHPYMGAGHEILTRMAESIKDRMAGKGFSEEDRKLANATHRAISEAIIQSLGEYNARSSSLQRKNIAGIKPEEMARAFFTQGNADNQFIASMKHNTEVNAHAADLRIQKDMGGDRNTKQYFYNELQARRALSVNSPNPPWLGNALRFTSVWKLITSPAYYLQYISQPITMFMPLIAGDHTGTKAWGALASGMKDVIGISKGLFDVDLSKIRDPKERAMLEDLTRTGAIGIGHEQQFGHLQTLPDGSVSKMWHKTTNTLTQFPHSIEMHNRIASALASYRLHMEKNVGDHQGAIDYARKNINTAYGDYSSFNAPRIMQGGAFTKLALQYRQFQIIHTSMLGRLLHNAFADESPDIRKTAKIQLTYMAGHYGVLAGALGIPAAHVLAGAMRAAFGDKDLDADNETFIKRHVADKTVQDLLLGGVPRAVFGQDLANRMGAGDILSPFKNVDMGDALKSKKGYKDATIAALGPFIGGMVPQVVDGVDSISKGDYYRGLEQLMPKGIGDAMKAYRYSNEGVIDKRGETRVRPDQIGAGDIFAQALGSNPSNIVGAAHEAGVVGKIQQKYKDQANTLKSQFVRARKSGESVDDIMEQWRTMMGKQKLVGIKPSPISELHRAVASVRKGEHMLIDGVPYNKNNKGLVQQITGEAQ